VTAVGIGIVVAALVLALLVPGMFTTVWTGFGLGVMVGLGGALIGVGASS
jgi:hypothetical protein